MSAQNNVSGFTAVPGFNMGLHESWASSTWFTTYRKVMVHLTSITPCGKLLFVGNDEAKRLPFEEFPQRSCLITAPDRVMKKDVGYDPNELIDPRQRYKSRLLGAFERGDELHVLMKVHVIKKSWPSLFYISLTDPGTNMTGLNLVALDFFRTEQALAA